MALQFMPCRFPAQMMPSGLLGMLPRKARACRRQHTAAYQACCKVDKILVQHDQVWVSKYLSQAVKTLSQTPEYRSVQFSDTLPELIDLYGLVQTT